MFSWPGYGFWRHRGTLQVLQVGDHGETRDPVVARRENARLYAQQHSAADALVLMEQNEIPESHRPPAWQIKNFRPSRAVVKDKAVADCVGSLQEFLKSPPPNMIVWDDAVCCADKIQIGFHSALALERLQSMNISSFVMDFTFSLGQQNLCLGGVGPVALRLDKRGVPSMRMMPVFFILARSEDQDGQKALFLKYAEAVQSFGVELTHGYCDCFYFQGVEAAVKSLGGFERLRLHRLGSLVRKSTMQIFFCFTVSLQDGDFTFACVSQ